MEPVPEDMGGSIEERPLTEKETTILLTIYDNAGETRNADVTIRWLMAAVFFPLVTALLVFVVLPNIAEKSGLAILGGLAGLYFTACWYGLETVMLNWISYWIGKLTRGEELLNPPMKVFSGEEYEQRFGNRILTTNRLLMFIIVMFAITFGLFTFLSLNQQYRWLPITASWLQTPSATQQKLERRIEELQNGIQQLQQKLEQTKKTVQNLQKPIPMQTSPRKIRKGARR